MKDSTIKSIVRDLIACLGIRNSKTGKVDVVACSKGWSKRCANSRSKQCSCKCGGLFHAVRKNERHQRRIGQTNIFNFL